MTKTILVVDDDTEVLEMVRIVLEENGYRVITANDAKACMREIVVKKPDLIVMDVRMPNMDGLNALDMIRVTQLNKAVPVIMWSGEADAEMKARAEKLGADDFITKDIGMPEFVRRIKSQFVQLDFTMVQQVLKGISGEGAALPEGIDPQANEGWRSYPVKWAEMDMLVLLAPGADATAAPGFSLVDAGTKVQVFLPLTARWKRLWPK